MIDRHRASFLLVMILAAGLRLAIVLARPADLSTDPDGYLAHAEMLANGHGFAGPYTQKPTAFRPPGYTLLIALMPGTDVAPERAVAMLHVAVGIITVLLTRQLAEQIGLSIGKSNLAALLVACDPLLVRYSALPMSEVTSACLLAAAVLYFRRFRESGERDVATGKRLPGRLIPEGLAAGICLGVSVLVRPVVLVVVALLTLALLVREFHWWRVSSAGADEARQAAGVTGKLLRSVLPACVVAVVLTPWIVRNAFVFGKLIPATSHGGYTLALGNNPDYYRDVVRGNPNSAWNGEALRAWQERMIREAADSGAPAEDEPATDAWYYQQASAAILADPGGFAGACLVRLKRFWSLESATGSGLSRRITQTVAVWYALLWVGVVAALLAAISRRTGYRTSDLWLTILAFLLVHTVFWTDTRMRAPVMPLLCVLAVVGTDWIAGGIMKGRRFESK